VEIRQLEHFVAVAEEGHFGRAADRSNIVQSGLSASIRTLERELGTRLFDRTTRRVSLTESGGALLPEARLVLAAATAAREAVAGVEGLTRGTLSIGIMQSLVAVRLPAMLARFRSLHPGVDIRLRQAGTAILLQEVREGRLELAFASLTDPAPTGLVGHELLSEELMLACAPEHPLAGRAAVRLADLRDEHFVDGDPAWGIRTSNDRAFRDAGVERHVAFAVNDMPTILDLVAHNLGVALLPRSLVPLRTPLRFVRLRGTAPRFNVTLVAREPRELSAASRALFAMVVGMGGSSGHARPGS
jgi:DNA-binding transcriptional LysR family regulator